MEPRYIFRGNALAGEAAQRRLPHGGSIHVFAAIDQRQQRAQDARLGFIGHGEAARGHMHQRFAARRDLLHEFHLVVVAGLAERCFAVHFRAFLLDEKGEMKQAQALRGEPPRHGVLASLCIAHVCHGHTRKSP